MGLKDRLKGILAPKEMELVESCDIEKGLSKVEIWFDKKNQEYLYRTIEPELDQREKSILKFIEETIIATIRADVDKMKDKTDFLRNMFEKVMKEYQISADDSKLFYYLKRDFLGYGKIDVPMSDPLLEDISCNGPKVPVYVYHKNYENIRTNIFFDELELDSFVIKLAQKCGKHISIADPLLDASFPDGSRLQATYSKEVTAGGSSFTIRKFREEPFTPIDLTKYGTIDPRIAAFYWLMVENGKNMVFGGGTACGKTTTLNAVSLYIPPNAKIVSIEDTREVNLPHQNWIKSVTRTGFGGEVVFGKKAGEIDMYELLKAALRQRPEYIIVGEVRGIEATVAFQAMATGHTVYTTLHAESTPAVVHRLESEPINIPRIILQALNLVSIQEQMKIGGKKQRKIKEITEIIGVEPETKHVLTNNVFRYDEVKDGFVYSGRSYTLEGIAKTKGIPLSEIEKEWRLREKIIRWMLDKGIRRYTDFANVVSRYYRERENVIKEVGA